MQKNDLVKFGEQILRILDLQEEKVLVIDCIKRTMPKFLSQEDLKFCKSCKEADLQKEAESLPLDMDSLNAAQKKTAFQRYTMISGILPFIADIPMRTKLIERAAEENKISRQTVRKYLCLYLSFQNIAALSPESGKGEKRKLTREEKNFRWALNKYFYNKNRNSLKTAYTLLLKDKYCDREGRLLPDYPSFYQFRYFYRKTRNLQTFYISRDGLSDYQRNSRPLLGDGVREFAPCIGTGMLDSTVCDIYLVDEAGTLTGRPLLTVCIDAYSGLCCGYSLSWEGGIRSLRELMFHVISDKQEHCRKFGISISGDEWDCTSLPGRLVTDRGSEYKGSSFEQLSELGVTIVNLPAYRAELKGSVEKFFDCIQSYYKPFLRGRGVVEPDFQERGTHDYRKDASLTMKQFETILLHCILFYNNKRVLERFPYTKEMLQTKIKPVPSEIWKWGKKQAGANLINIEKKQLILTLLPRTTGTFKRNGLIVNHLRYKNPNYAEQYLQGKEVTISYNPDDVDQVFLTENGRYIPFHLIESRFRGMKLQEAGQMQEEQRQLIRQEQEEKLRAEIQLADHILAVREQSERKAKTSVKNIRETRKKEQSRTHRNLLKEAAYDE